MNSFYEERQDNENIINFNLGPKFTYPPHFHQKVEIFFLLSGEFGVWRNGVHYNLKSGNIMFFDSYDVHAYDERFCDVKGLVLIIPQKNAQAFFLRKNGKKVINPLISDPELCKELHTIATTYVTDTNIPNSVRNSAIELILSRLELMLEFDKGAESDETTLAQNLLIFLNKHFQDDLNLSLIAKKFGYSKEHVSRVFHRYINCGIPNYINNLRLDYVENALLNGVKTNITDLLFEAGFKSIQSYYRAKNKRKIALD